MGGLRRLMPLTSVASWIGGARARRHAAVRRLLLEGLDPRRGARDGGWYGYLLFAVGLVGHVPDRRSTPSGCSSSSSAASRPRSCASTSTRHGARPWSAGRWSCPSACSPSLAVVGGFAPVRRRLDTRLRLARAGRRRRSSTRRARRRRSRASSRSRSGSPGSASPGGSTARAERVRRRAPVALLEHKFCFDELYDAALLPAGRRARAALLDAVVERPLVLAARSTGSPASVRDLGAGSHAALQTGPRAHLRAGASPRSLAVLDVVFVAVRLDAAG